MQCRLQKLEGAKLTPVVFAKVHRDLLRVTAARESTVVHSVENQKPSKQCRTVIRSKIQHDYSLKKKKNQHHQLSTLCMYSSGCVCPTWWESRRAAGSRWFAWGLDRDQPTMSASFLVLALKPPASADRTSSHIDGPPVDTVWKHRSTYDATQ